MPATNPAANSGAVPKMFGGVPQQPHHDNHRATPSMHPEVQRYIAFTADMAERKPGEAQHQASTTQGPYRELVRQEMSRLAKFAA